MVILTLFGSAFLVVFFLGLQAQAVRDGLYINAFINSLMIGSANLLILKAAPSATGIEIAAYLLGGPFGIITSMVVHDRWIARKK